MSSKRSSGETGSMTMREAREAQQRDPMTGVDLDYRIGGTVAAVDSPCHVVVVDEDTAYAHGWCETHGSGMPCRTVDPLTPVYGPRAKWGAVAATVVGLSLFAGGVNAVASEPTDSPFWTTRVCQQEDSANCAWDAGTSGNGAGHSFITRDLPGDANRIIPGRQVTTCVFYTDRDYARTHDYCD